VDNRPSTASGRFAGEGLPRWRRLRSLLESTRKKGPRALRYEAREFVRLYRSASADLASARSRRLAPDIVEYLNALVGEAHARIYDLPPLKRGAVGHWILNEVPARVAKAWPFVLVAAILFLSSWTLSFAAVSAKPATAAALMDRGTLASFDKMYSDPAFMKATGSEAAAEGSAAAVTWYIRNNVTVSFLSFALGAFFGLGSLVVVLVNGLSMGAIVGYVSASGHGRSIWTFMAAHSVFELAGLVLSAAAGLLLGWTLFRGGRAGRAAALKERTDDILALVTADVILTVGAAFIEGLFSPRRIGLDARLAVAFACLLLELGYFVVLPLRLRRRSKSLTAGGQAVQK